MSTELATLENFRFALLKIVKTTELRYILQSKGLNRGTSHDIACYECNCKTVGIKFYVKKIVAFVCMCFGRCRFCWARVHVC